LGITPQGAAPYPTPQDAADRLWRPRLAQIFCSLLRANHNIVQARLLGGDGLELVRIDRIASALRDRPPAERQNKGL
jgi:hypothetical protein